MLSANHDIYYFEGENTWNFKGIFLFWILRTNTIYKHVLIMNSLNDTVSCFDCLSFHPYIVFDVIVTQAVFENVFGNPLYTSQMFKRRLRNVLLDMVFSYLFLRNNKKGDNLIAIFRTSFVRYGCLKDVFWTFLWFYTHIMFVFITTTTTTTEQFPCLSFSFFLSQY